MDQDGNSNSKRPPQEYTLKYWADLRRAADKAREEARRLGLPEPRVGSKAVPVEPKPEAVLVKQQEAAGEPNEILLTSSEAAKLLGFSEKGFRNAVSSGRIPHYKLFGQNRFKKNELLSLLVKVETK